MAAHKKILVVGASGLVGSAVVRHLRQAGCSVVCVSRRPPLDTWGAAFVAADLFDAGACRSLFEQMTDVTHLVYAALYERPTLVDGWSHAEQIEINARMFRNFLDPLAGLPLLKHVTLLQGTKAYGVHVRPIPIPAREGRDELRSQPNFYWEQESYLRSRQHGAAWSWTILRPVLVVGDAVGSAMNVAAAIGVFGALLKEEGLPLAFPGGGPRIAQAVGADLLARAVAWCGEAEAASREVFNFTNGDVFVWSAVWPAITEALGMETGEAVPRSIEEYCTARAARWEHIRTRAQLAAPALADFLGPSLQYADYALRCGQSGDGAPSIVSTIKIQSAGFHEVEDTEVMLSNTLRTLQERRLLPRP